ncbi:MAG TPA: phosphoglucomutase (alpha-D-glucose-1,6-bisphosphate-dependent) [Steroidobacteraceae bacterium]|nr:phosphoglucomutase (alpha-D-glucose-1,6-bisphosphate-dependent) [Steroidobacteraceae bacterium]
MNAKVHPLAGKPAPKSVLTDIPRLLTAYYTERPDPAVPAQRIAFGTSGHRGSSFECSFNEAHVLAISQAICAYRAREGITGPLFLAFDTHALSAPAFASALEVLAANGVQVMISAGGEYTPTPALSHAILVYNRGRESALADGIVITPSHNPPDSGGFKYNPPNGGPADSAATGWIEAEANRLIEARLDGVKRMPFAAARRASTTQEYDFLGRYVEDLGNVIDMDVIRSSKVRLAVDPGGGAGVHYWPRIAERYGLDLTVVREDVDPRFAFMTLDWDGRIRMDPSSPYAMQPLIGLKDRFDVTFACDTDHDRHGIVTRSVGLMPSNNYLAVMVDYLFRHRPQWKAEAAIGKTAVSSSMIDRVAQRLGRRLYEVPVGFKWYVDGLLSGALAFGGEESAGAAFSRMDGTVWTTDKDGMAPGLLSGEITARLGRDPGEVYRALGAELGNPVAARIDARATREQKTKLSKLSPSALKLTELAGDPIVSVTDRAAGNGAPIGGIKVSTANGWFAARPSGTEDVYKIYGESFRGEEHLQRILAEAQKVVDAAIA